MRTPRRLSDEHSVHVSAKFSFNVLVVLITPAQSIGRRCVLHRRLPAPQMRLSVSVPVSPGEARCAAADQRQRGDGTEAVGWQVHNDDEGKEKERMETPTLIIEYHLPGAYYVTEVCHSQLCFSSRLVGLAPSSLTISLSPHHLVHKPRGQPISYS